MVSNYFSPAKINLFLRLLGRREDGFHELATLIQAVDLGDSIRVGEADEDRFSCSDSTLPTDETNLAELHGAPRVLGPRYSIAGTGGRGKGGTALGWRITIRR